MNVFYRDHASNLRFQERRGTKIPGKDIAYSAEQRSNGVFYEEAEVLHLQMQVEKGFP